MGRSNPRSGEQRFPEYDYRESGANRRSNPGYGPARPDYGGYGQQYPEYDTPNGGYGHPGESQRSSGWSYDQSEYRRGAPGGAYPQSQGGYQPEGYPYAGEPYGQQTGYGRRGSPLRKSRSRVLPVVIVVLLLLMASAGAGAFALMRGDLRALLPTAKSASTPADTTTPGVPAGFKVYADPAAHVQIDVPNDWTTKGTITSQTGLQIISPDKTSGLLMKQYSQSLDKVGAATGFLNGGAGTGTLANKQGPTSVSLAGETWVQESADVTRDGETVHTAVLVTVHDSTTYLLGYLALRSSFDATNTHYFQPAINSFAFI